MLTYETLVIGVTSILYLSVGVSYLLKGNIPLSVVWTAYGIANAALIWAITQQIK